MNAKFATPKPCKAKGCPETFIPKRPFEKWCSPACAWEIAKEKLAKKKAVEAKVQRAADLKTRERLKPRSAWLRDAQSAVNAFVRQRDAGIPCISCGKPDTGARDAGHFFTTGARPELRFDLDNIHAQCVKCNQHLHGNLAYYRIGLLEKIGEARIARLEGPHAPLHLSVDDLKTIRDTYRAKVRELKRQADGRQRLTTTERQSQ